MDIENNQKKIVFQNRATSILDSMPNALKGETEEQYRQAVDLAEEIAYEQVEKLFMRYPFEKPEQTNKSDMPF